MQKATKKVATFCSNANGIGAREGLKIDFCCYKKKKNRIYATNKVFKQQMKYRYVRTNVCVCPFLVK